MGNHLYDIECWKMSLQMTTCINMDLILPTNAENKRESEKRESFKKNNNYKLKTLTKN